MRAAILTLLTAAAVCAQQHGQASEKKIKNPVASKPEAVAAGLKLFRESCSVCHGVEGGGGRGPNLRDGDQVRGMDDEKLFDVIKKGVPGTEMPPSPHPDERVWEMAAYVRALSAPAFENLPPGDPEAGERVFWGKGGCGGCHMIRGRGGFLGPDLSDAGGTRSAARMRETILNPNEGSRVGFQGVVAVRKDGRKIEGVAKNFTNYSMQILDKTGRLHSVSKADLASVELRRKSIMPGDFKARLSAKELDDVIAYLSRRIVRLKGEETK